MHDMLVKLYDLPDIRQLEEKMKNDWIEIRRPLASEKSMVVSWVKEYYGNGWASETDVCFSFHPVSCFIAIKDKQVIGFACYDSAFKNFFGPTGVEESFQRRSIGKTLLLKCLYAMREQGYAYGIIGGVGPAKFYENAVNAKLIQGSNPGIYKGSLSELPME